MILHSQIQGQGQPVVLIHGLFGSLENLGLLARALSQTHQVISVDLRNHGRSHRAQSMTYPEMANDLQQTLDHLQLAQVSLVGHSMGGKVAMSMALHHPERVKQLVVVDIAPVAYAPGHDAVFRGLDAVPLSRIQDRREADRLMSRHIDDPGVRQFLLKSLLKQPQQFDWRFDVQALRDNYRQIIDWPQTDRQYTGPTLFIKGEQSDYLRECHRSAVAEHFPEARAKVVAGSGHWVHAEKPELFNRLVYGFLTG